MCKECDELEATNVPVDLTEEFLRSRLVGRSIAWVCYHDDALQIAMSSGEVIEFPKDGRPLVPFRISARPSPNDARALIRAKIDEANNRLSSVRSIEKEINDLARVLKSLPKGD